MSKQCEICGKQFQKEGYAKTDRHVNSKWHQLALTLKESLTASQHDSSQHTQSLGQLILFQGLKQLEVPNYQNLLKFARSFKVKMGELSNLLIEKIIDGDVEYNKVENKKLAKFYDALFTLTDIRFPLSVKVIEVPKQFPDLDLSTPQEVLDFFSDLNKTYSGFVSITPIQIGGPKDLLTFKTLFPPTVVFQCARRWTL